MGKWILVLFLTCDVLWGQETPAPAATEYLVAPSETQGTPIPRIIRKWSITTVPWAAWFKKNALVTDKTDHVHFFWDCQDFKSNFEVKDKKVRLAEAALALVKLLYPKDSKADLAKVDIVYVLERDNYGEPKWDSLQQVAHFEFQRSKAVPYFKKGHRISEADFPKIFDKVEYY